MARYRETLWRDDADGPGAAPPVIEPDDVEPSEGEEAELTYVPSERVLQHDQEARLELRRTEDGRVALACYSSVSSLVQCCGDLQPWVGIPRDKISEIQQRSGADLIAWDVELPAAARNDSNDIANAGAEHGGESK